MNLWRRVPTRPAVRLPTRHAGDGWSSTPGVQYGPGGQYGPPVGTPVRAVPVAATRTSTHVLLFFLTLFSMMVAGAMQQGVNPLLGWGQLVHLVEGLPFAATLLAILTVHEFGHYFAARRWQVKASLPYFIPLPYLSFLGTLGAVIRIRSPIPNKRALLDIGASGPIAGFVIAVIACAVGLPMSRIVDAGYFGQLPRQLEPDTIQLGAPLLFDFLSNWLLPAVGDEQLVLLSPVAFAGWVGLFITAFNLFPVGQLDGGHIAYALTGSAHRLVGRLTFSALLVLGAYGVLSLVADLPAHWPAGWPGWLALALLLTVFGRDHPPPYNPTIPLDRRRRVIGILCLTIFILCFTPVPFGALAG
ncbi:MAG TPA: site-2 protease family protein [Candidatus Latescibacteria bacterium]|jgi:membrane-associated protease RseP (regulator of RpoE activity)|nr:site-2 protease family protein [Candidatus Latescibacterota bacterium]HJP31397.1 site-2 protease family protein [Candidatus Latescibacterota bacterium]